MSFRRFRAVNLFLIKWDRFSRVLSIPRSSLVLDVGSGDAPFPRADVIGDRFVEDDAQRLGAVVRDRPFVALNIEKLPFRDRAFDYIIASHVLEHTEDPAKACDEIQRVAKAGYIEVPHKSHERIQPVPSHRWQCSLDAGALVFETRTEPDPHLREMTDELLRKREPTYLNFYLRHLLDRFVIRLPWEGSFRYEVRGEPAARSGDQHDPALTHETCAPSTTGLGFKKLLRLFVFPKHRFSLDDLLACPECRAPLGEPAEQDSYCCSACGMTYPIKNGIPFLIADH